MRDPRFGATKMKIEQRAENVTVSLEQLRLVADAFEKADDRDTTKRLADMVRNGAFEDIQTVMRFTVGDRIVSSSHTMEVLRHFGYAESFLSDEGSARFLAHMRFKHETRINYYIPKPGDPRTASVHPIISIVHEFYKQIDGLIEFTCDRYKHDITRGTQETERALSDFTELLVEYTHGGAHALSDGIL